MIFGWVRLVVGSAVVMARASGAMAGGQREAQPYSPSRPPGTTDPPKLLPPEIQPQEPIFFPNRASQWTLRDASQRDVTSTSLDDLTVVEEDGFFTPIVPPLGPLPPPPPSPDISDGSHRFRDSSLDLWDAEDPTKDTGYWESQDRSDDFRNGISGAQGVATRAWPVMCGSYRLPGGSSLTLRTPYHPAGYTNRFKCRWTITTESEGKMMVHCSPFSLGRGDTLTLAYGPGGPTRYQRRRGPVNQTLHTSSVTLVFSSNRSKNSVGFTCCVTALGPATTISETTTTTTTPTTTTASTTTSSPVAKTSRPALTTTTSPTATSSTTSRPIKTTTTTTGMPLSHPDCGVSEATSRIVNGKVSLAHKFPWQALLTSKWSDGEKQLCGGSLVSNQWVLTAAHCVLRKKRDGKLWLPTVRAKLGVHRINDPGRVSVTASAINIYPENSFTYDLALLKLPSAVLLDRKVRPVCLPPISMLNQNVTGLRLTSSGWGKTESGKISPKLRELSQLGIESAICKKVFGKYITGHHFCTSGIGVKHICLGDSGGPVMLEVESRMVLVGVVSFVATKNCTLEYPDGHTSVAHFLDWIWDTIGRPGV